MARLENKRAIVTGAASGIGRATAALFASEGASVVCVDVNGADVKETAAAIESSGGHARRRSFFSGRSRNPGGYRSLR